MHIISRQALKQCSSRHADVKSELDAWYYEVKNACWKTPRDIKQRYPSADFLIDNRVVFNIKGTAYRLVAIVHYADEISNGTVFIRFVDTHAEYDKIDAEKI
jgi:mRNA interferase HigB